MNRVLELAGEQGVNEVNGGDRSYTPFEKFIVGVQVILKLLFFIGAPMLAYHALTYWNVR
jgi:hypothetical protein